MELFGKSLVGTRAVGFPAPEGWPDFRALNPQSGEALEPGYFNCNAVEMDRALELATQAFSGTRSLSGKEKAGFLAAIAAGLEAAGDVIVERAGLETALPPARLQGELGRTSAQLRLFASLVEEGSWVDARVDPGNVARKPLPKPDVRSLLRPLGPVAVFGASNFPLAFSVAGGDTAAALAAGCPVIAKAHPAHPGTCELVAAVIGRAARETGMPDGIFSVLFDAGHKAGLALVRHPGIKAVSFTGSRRGGMALRAAAAGRPRPIPVFAEMSSINPAVITLGSLDQRGAELAAGLHGAITLGVGQFCTNPGLVLLPAGKAGDAFMETLAAAMRGTPPAALLTPAIGQAYVEGLYALLNSRHVRTYVGGEWSGSLASPSLFETTAVAFMDQPELGSEVFGPASLVVRYASRGALESVLESLEGQLTATLHAEPDELENLGRVLELMEERAGRLIVNGFPTGVEVGSAMVHGGPFPATTDGQSSSVGTRAIFRFVRPVCYQGFPQAALPAELQDGNPLGINRMVEGRLGRE